MVPPRARRGCWWYIGVATVGGFGLLVLLVVALILYVHNTISPYSTVVSARDQTYLEAETTNHGEGFLDGYDWLEVYYIQKGWVWNKRVQVYNFPHASAREASFRRSLDGNGQVQIDILSRGAVLAIFVPPAAFPEQ